MTEYKKLDFDETCEYLYALENNYAPPLSKRVDDFGAYVNKLAQNAVNLGAYDSVQNKPLGYIGFYANNPALGFSYISQIVVDKSAQGQGIGKMLIDICKRISKEKGFSCIKLEVRKDNTAAQRFYKKNSFAYESENDGSIYLICKL